MSELKQKENESVQNFILRIRALVNQLSNPPDDKSLRAWLITGCTQLDLHSHKVVNPTKTYEDLLDRAIALEKSGAVKHKSKKKLEVSDEEPDNTKKDGMKAKLRKALRDMGIRGKPTATEKWCPELTMTKAHAVTRSKGVMESPPKEKSTTDTN